MGKLIDSDWLRAQWDEPTDWMDGDQVLHHYTWYKTMIDVAPSVDAVPVVRCRDCEYWDTIPRSTVAPLHHQCKETRLMTTGIWYCPLGKRKDGDGNG